MRQSMSVAVEDCRFNPVLAALVSARSVLPCESARTTAPAACNRLPVARHGGKPASANSLAHRFVEQRGNDPTVKKPWVAFECIRNIGWADHRSVLPPAEIPAEDPADWLRRSQSSGSARHEPEESGCRSAASSLRHLSLQALARKHRHRHCRPSGRRRFACRDSISFSFSAPASAAAAAPSATLCVS